MYLCLGSAPSSLKIYLWWHNSFLRDLLEERPDQCSDSHSPVATSIRNRESIWSCQSAFQMSWSWQGYQGETVSITPCTAPHPQELAEGVPPADSISTVCHGQGRQEVRGEKGGEGQGEGAKQKEAEDNQGRNA